MERTPSDLIMTREELPAAVRGVAIGLANLLVIAIGFGPGSILVVAMFGCIPAAVAGGLIGVLAGLTARSSPWWRAALLAVPAFGVVAGLGAFFDVTAAIPVACIPTLVAALVLERWTRKVAPALIATARSLPT